MSAVLKLGNRKLAAEELISLVAKSQMLPQLLREVIIEGAIAPIEYSFEETGQIYQKLVKDEQYEGMTYEQLEEIAIRKLKLEKFKQAKWGKKIESYFLTRKAQLDRVVCSIIQVEEPGVAQEIYFRLQEGEDSFAELARNYSQGFEARNGGTIGPIKLNNLHPKIAQRLRATKPGELSPLFRFEKYFVIVRLERLIPAQLDERMRALLLNELFEGWLKRQITQEISLTNAENTNDSVSGKSEKIKQSHLNKKSFPDKPKTPQKVETGEEAGGNSLLQGAEALKTTKGIRIAPRRGTNKLIEKRKDNWQPKRLPATNNQTSNQQKTKLARALVLCLISLGLGGWYLTSFRQSTTNQTKVSSVSEQDFFPLAINNATEAANLTQSAQSSSEWEIVAKKWEEAIALMKVVSPEDTHYDLAKQKVVEYHRNLQYAKTNVEKLVDRFRLAINEANQATKLTQTAQSSTEWKEIGKHWQEAIALLKTIKSDHPNYDLAKEKVVEYHSNLSYVKAKIRQVDTFRLAVNKATKAANLTQTAQLQTEWDLVAQYWQEAIALMKAVKKNNPNYSTAQEKVFEYQRNLDYAKANVKKWLK